MRVFLRWWGKLILLIATICTKVTCKNAILLNFLIQIHTRFLKFKMFKEPCGRQKGDSKGKAFSA